MSTFGPELLHLLFAVLGAGLGWYARHASLGVSPEVLTLVEKLLATRKEGQARGLLRDLLDEFQAASAPPPPPPAKTS
jgi:hypothetical protein